MSDRIMTQVRFKRVLWTCPQCKQEDIEDRSMTGGDSYVHTCSSCSEKFNQSCGRMKEYNGCITMLASEYETKQETDITAEKKKLFDDWVYGMKNPPKYVEPTKEELEKMRDEKAAEVAELERQISAKTVEK